MCKTKTDRTPLQQTRDEPRTSAGSVVHPISQDVPLTKTAFICWLVPCFPRRQAAPVALSAGVPLGLQGRGDFWKAARRLQQDSGGGHGGGTNLLRVDVRRLLQPHLLPVRTVCGRRALLYGEDARNSVAVPSCHKCRRVKETRDILGNGIALSL